MKKFTYALASAALLAACSGNPGYTVTGTIDGAPDGTVVYLQRQEGRQSVKVDSAIVQNGQFTLEGRQDTAQVRALTCQVGDDALGIDFFLENGAITVQLSADTRSVTGTPNNDAYQLIRQQLNDLSKQLSAIYESLEDSTLTDEQRELKEKDTEAIYDKMTETMNAGIAQNATNAVGVYLLKQNYYNMSVEQLEPIVTKIPAELTDEAIVRIKEKAEKLKVTAVGQKFVDFEMQTPDGKTVKLSDYVGKGKVVLVDFWASWCGPCRQEMPNLVEAYKKYRNKNFEIVGVSLDRDAEAWKKGIEKLNITWPQMSDLKYWDSEGANLYAVSSIPHTVLIDGDGVILARGLHGDELQEKLAEVLK